jgi:hypothetical protein
MAHKRSKQKREEKATKKQITYFLKTKLFTESYHDKTINETVSKTTHTALEQYGIQHFGETTYNTLEEQMKKPFLENVDIGVVLIDTKGNGALQ